MSIPLLELRQVAVRASLQATLKPLLTHGALTKEDEVWWDRIEDFEEEIAQLTSMLKIDRSSKFLRRDLAHSRKMRKLLAKRVPDYKPRPSKQKRFG